MVAECVQMWAENDSHALIDGPQAAITHLVTITLLIKLNACSLSMRSKQRGELECPMELPSNYMFILYYFLGGVGN